MHGERGLFGATRMAFQLPLVLLFQVLSRSKGNQVNIPGPGRGKKTTPSKSVGSVATQANLETSAKAPGRVLFSF